MNPANTSVGRLVQWAQTIFGDQFALSFGTIDFNGTNIGDKEFALCPIAIALNPTHVL